jgi:hypothetical protein
MKCTCALLCYTWLSRPLEVLERPDTEGPSSEHHSANMNGRVERTFHGAHCHTAIATLAVALDIKGREGTLCAASLTRTPLGRYVMKPRILPGATCMCTQHFSPSTHSTPPSHPVLTQARLSSYSTCHTHLNAETRPRLPLNRPVFHTWMRTKSIGCSDIISRCVWKELRKLRRSTRRNGLASARLLVGTRSDKRGKASKAPGPR